MSAPKKLVIIGPECTGKSTLCSALAAALNTPWVPEFARQYLDEIRRPYEEPDLFQIALGQIALEDAQLKQMKEWLICDTDLYVLKVWSEARYGRCDRHILESIACRHYDLYLLTDTDIPWQSDPQREHPNASDRRFFYHQYRDIVQQSGCPWAEIRGNKEERLNRALEAILSFH
ncbi:MAG: ATP-binding protein [Bacteroidetes bacterium]|nr:ATP-binding protein [Bacteroidota bacterium]MBS1629353.1 ATP-binding protein [Bacteroidota bacterium]